MRFSPEEPSIIECDRCHEDLNARHEAIETLDGWFCVHCVEELEWEADQEKGERYAA